MLAPRVFHVPSSLHIPSPGRDLIYTPFTVTPQTYDQRDQLLSQSSETVLTPHDLGNEKTGASLVVFGYKTV